MACSCRNKRIKDGPGGGGNFAVQLKGGLKIPKNSEAEAKAFAAKHPGAIVVKSA